MGADAYAVLSTALPSGRVVKPVYLSGGWGLWVQSRTLLAPREMFGPLELCVYGHGRVRGPVNCSPKRQDCHVNCQHTSLVHGALQDMRAETAASNSFFFIDMDDCGALPAARITLHKAPEYVGA